MVPPAQSLAPKRAATRYRKNRPPTNLPSDDDSSGDEEHQDDEVAMDEDEDEGEKIVDLTLAPGEKREVRRLGKGKGAGDKKLSLALGDVTAVRGETKVTKDSARPPAFRSAPVPGKEESSEYESESGEEGSSSEEDSSSEEEEEPSAPLYKPVFVSKRQRDTTTTTQPLNGGDGVGISVSIGGGGSGVEGGEGDKEREEREEKERIRKKEEARKMVEISVRREMEEKEATSHDALPSDVDGLDSTTEFESWKLRELLRIQRDRESRYAREKEREEIEERRNLPTEVRDREDEERAKRIEEERKEKRKEGGPKFLQKYYHKGAFYADSDILNKRDYSEATESTVKDMAALPKVMQVRDFGKMSRTKWTHLVAEDTTDRQAGWGADKNKGGRKGQGVVPGILASGNPSGNGCFNCGGPDHIKRDCPLLKPGADLSSFTGTGSNSGPIGSRGPPEDAPKGPAGARHRDRERERDGDRRNDTYRDRQRYPGKDRDHGGYRESRDRDRDRREDGHSSRRRRSPSPYDYRKGRGDRVDRDGDVDMDGKNGGRRRRERSTSRDRDMRTEDRDKRRRVD